MAERSRARAAGLRLAPLALAAMLASSPALAQHWEFTPSAGATETYTDNVNLASDSRAHGQFVSEAWGALSLAGVSQRLKLSASAAEHQFVFSRSMPGTNDRQLVYKLGAEAVAVPELLYLDAQASGGPQAVSAFGPQINGNLYSMGNRADVSTWAISPWLHHRFAQSAELTMRYTRDGVDAGARNAFASSTSSTASAQLASGRSWNTLGWGLSYMRQDLDNRLAGRSSSAAALANLSWRLGRSFSLTGTGGYDKYDYASLGGTTAGRSWSAGFIWEPSARTRVQASAGRRYFGKTGSLAATHRSRHTVWNISYHDDVTTSRSRFLLPATIDTASMLDRLFMAMIPDPTARAAAVAAYMQANNLPSSLADNINYMSNRFMRQKDFQLGAAFTGAHSNLLVGVFDSTRIALSSQQSDSALLGSDLLALNDSTRQKGINSIWTYTLSPRSTATLSATVGRVKSLSTGFTNNHHLLRAGLTHRFGQKLYGVVDVRHSGGGIGAGTGQHYSENAVSATVAMQF